MRRHNFLTTSFVIIAYAYIIKIHNELATLGEWTGPQGGSLALSTVDNMALSLHTI
jgi:hypothetical protein